MRKVYLSSLIQLILPASLRVNIIIDAPTLHARLSQEVIGSQLHHPFPFLEDRRVLAQAERRSVPASPDKSQRTRAGNPGAASRIKKPGSGCSIKGQADQGTQVRTREDIKVVSAKEAVFVKLLPTS